MIIRHANNSARGTVGGQAIAAMIRGELRTLQATHPDLSVEQRHWIALRRVENEHQRWLAVQQTAISDRHQIQLLQGQIVRLKAQVRSIRGGRAA